MTTTGKTHKVCFKCKEKKPVEDFYRHSAMADGYVGKCKDCNRADVTAHRAAHRPAIAFAEKHRAQTPARKKQARDSQQRRKENRPEREQARYLTTNAIRDGRLIRQPCEVCRSIKVEAHHDDYTKPLDVRWLCRKHHLEHHGKVSA